MAENLGLVLGDSITLISPDGVDVIGRDEATLPLPDAWDLSEYHSYRLFTRNGKVLIYLEQYLLGELSVAEGPYCAAVLCQNTSIALEMVRMTGI